jgi:glyoxylase-like metal-dependent hydrolase (beta-lactamase superfamily II)
MLKSLQDLKITRAEELVLNVPLSLFAADEALIESERVRLSPHFFSKDGATFELVFQTWIVQAQNLKIVIDPCNGNDRSRPAMQEVHKLDTPFIERFEATGTKPTDVDIVFCTHLHCDHCGWNTRLRGGRWVPTFPNARYLFVREEIERWDPRNGYKVVDYNVGVFEECVQPIIDAGLAEIIGSQHEVQPGISIRPAKGHTLGHSILRLDTANARVYFTGDAFHHPLQVSDPTLHLSGCDDLAAAIDTRRRLANSIAEEGAIMIAAHFPTPHAGGVIRGRDRLEFVPLAE